MMEKGFVVIPFTRKFECNFKASLFMMPCLKYNKLYRMISSIFKAFLGVFVLVLMMNNQAHAQLPSDTTQLPYMVSEVVNIIVDGFENPTVQNEYVLKLTEQSGFPQVTVNQAIDSAKIQEIKGWVSQNPKSIERLLIDRKKYFDKYNSQNQ
ncbi:MAG: hypothetical protein Salg2KO_22840 [Salibacteraceae bacterium]